MGKNKPTPRWKSPRLKEDRKKKKKDISKEKHVRRTQSPEWLALKDWFWQVRRETWLSCGYSEDQIPPLFQEDNTNYYGNKNDSNSKTIRREEQTDKRKRRSRTPNARRGR